MKLAWITAAERHLPPSATGRALRLIDGSRDWHRISTAPFNRDLEIRVAGTRRPRRIPFPCRQETRGWINRDLGVRIELDPVDWRPWPDGG